MRTRPYRPPPVRPQSPESPHEPPGAFTPPSRTWLDLVDHSGHAAVTTDGWDQVITHLLQNSLSAGRYRVVGADGRSVARLVVYGGGRWEIGGI